MNPGYVLSIDRDGALTLTAVDCCADAIRVSALYGRSTGLVAMPWLPSLPCSLSTHSFVTLVSAAALLRRKYISRVVRLPPRFVTGARCSRVSRTCSHRMQHNLAATSRDLRHSRAVVACPAGSKPEGSRYLRLQPSSGYSVSRVTSHFCVTT